MVLGLISSKKAALESKDELKQRIEQASAFIPLERLALSPQCGFASTMEGNLLTSADQEAKLSLVAATATEVWGAPTLATRLRAGNTSGKSGPGSSRPFREIWLSGNEPEVAGAG